MLCAFAIFISCKKYIYNLHFSNLRVRLHETDVLKTETNTIIIP